MINSKECQEIFEFLSYMNKSEVMKIPIEILNFIKNNRNEKYKTKIDKNDLFNFDNLSENSLDFLLYIDNTYWKEKEEITDIKETTTFENKENKKENEQYLVSAKNKNLLQKILEKIRTIFNK